ncbi:MAG: LLM class flavin-dependent oxidoreductase [Deltaproteobacteria bacterium]|nr:MAG: LLM class flavin-dependent oxidoreductase [Deltaproteobacteria bacterium]
MVRFYINILTTYFPEIDPPYDVYYQQILEQVQLAEELGWECFMFNEHHFLGYGGLVANPAVLLAAAAARTSKIRLGPCIAILPLRHPLHSAEDYAMVDAISGGRLEFGIGSGNTELDYKVFGVTRENDRQRLDEAFEVILKAWTNDRFSHQGTAWQFGEITLYPRPIQKPHPPIWVAGTSAQTLEWAGRHGFHIMTVGHPHPPEKVRPGVEAWKKALIDQGIDPTERHCQFHARTHVNENAERAREIATAAITRYDEISRIGRRSLTVAPAEYNWEMMLATGRNNYGEPDQCIQNILNAAKNYYFDTLTTTFNFGGIPHAEIVKSMRLFAKEVMPAFR